MTRKETGGVAFYQAYIGWTTEQLFENIYLKIVELKDIAKMDSDNPNIRKKVRLLNVLKMIKLLLVHISKNDLIQVKTGAAIPLPFFMASA